MCVLALNTHTEILLQKFLSSHSKYHPIPPVICRVPYLPSTRVLGGTPRVLFVGTGRYSTGIAGSLIPVPGYGYLERVPTGIIPGRMGGSFRHFI